MVHRHLFLVHCTSAVLMAGGILAGSGRVALAQVTTAAIYGTVRDAQGGAVVRATVLLSNADTGAQAATISDGRGDFTYTLLPVGRYTLRVDASGFRPAVEESVTLMAGQVRRVTIDLVVGDVQTEVAVRADLVALNAVSAEQRESKDDRHVRELPLAQRDWTSVLAINTGVTLSNSQSLAAFNGLAPNLFTFTIDGVRESATQEYSAFARDGDFQLIKGIGIDAIDEVSTRKGIFTAETSNTISGTVNVISKGGTNAFHGSGFWNHQRDEYSARNPLLSSKSDQALHQFGVSVGGPVVRDRAFVFGAYEGYDQRLAQPVSGDVPGPDFLSRAIAAVPAYRSVLELFPQPTSAAASGAPSAPFIGPGNVTGSDHYVVLRFDQNLSSARRLTLRYADARPQQSNPTLLPSNPREYKAHTRSGTATLTSTWSAVTAETRLGYQDTQTDRLDGRYTQGIAGLAGAIGFSTGDGEIISTPGRVASVEQVVTWQHGRHLFKGGGIWARSTTGRANIEQPIFTYSSVDDFLANIPSAVRLTFGVAPFEIRSSQWGGFMQDDIRLTDRVVASVGLRYDYFSVPAERDGRFFNRDAPTGFGPLRPGDSIYEADSSGLAPRGSLAWSLDADSRTVIRAGGGKFIATRSVLGGIVDLVQTALDEPFRVTLTRAEALALGVRYPIANAEALRLVRGAPAQWTGATLSPDLPNPYSLQWLAGIERRLSPTTSVEASYVGNRAENLNYARVLGLPDRQTGLRPVPGFGTFRNVDASGSSSYHSVQTNVRRAFSRGLAASAHYTWSRNRSYGDANTGITLAAQDVNDRDAEYGPTPYDVPHAFAADWIYQIPDSGLSSPLAQGFFGGWQVSGLFRAQSGTPLNVTQSTSYPSSRPDALSADMALPDWRRTLRYLDRAAFGAVPIVSASGAGSRPGTLTRHAARGPGFWTVDLALAKNVTVVGTQRLQIRIDVFNALNRPIYTSVVTNINSSQFGQLTGATVRTAQLNLRYTF